MTLKPFTPEMSETAEEIFRQYKGLIWKVSIGILKDFSLAEDCLQETILKLAMVSEKLKRHEYANEQGFVSAVARNQAIDILKRQRREIPMQDYMITELKYDRDICRSDKYFVDENGFSEEINCCLRKLNEKDVDIILLRQRYNLTNSEIAEITHDNAVAVAQRYHRARGRLQKLLEEMDKEG